MKIAITGASGLVGSAFRKLYPEHDYLAITRSTSLDGVEKSVRWDIDKGTIDIEALEGLDAIIHLAGESIASLRWTEAKKQAIRDSRVLGTTLLVDSIAKLQEPPKVLISSSAIGYYGNTRGRVATETSSSGSGFLSDVCLEWERRLEPLKSLPIRLLTLRIGLVLAREGGALPSMLPPFRLGLGGVLGTGKQMMSWITLLDLLRSIDFLLRGTTESGVFNAVAPNAVSNYEFTKELGRALSRPTIIPVPEAVIKFALGEMGESLLLADTHVVPKALLDAGFCFEHANIQSAFEHLLTKRM
jgi:hypothetical protein